MRKTVRISPLGLDFDSDDASILPGFCRDIRNVIPKQGGLSKAGGVQNTPSNESFALPVSGTVIGSFEDKTNNRVFLFIKGSAQDHVYYFSPNSNSFTKVLSSAYLGFSTSSRISSVDCIEDILQWTDNLNEPRSIVVSDAVAGVYSESSSDIGYQISLQKSNPSSVMDAIRSTDGTVSINNVASDSWNFSFRYLYRDNTASFFSPPSKLVYADMYPNINSNTDNRVTMVIPIGAEVIPVVKKIQVAYIRNSDGNYFIFDEFDHDGVSSSYTKYFYNNESVTAVAPADLVKVNFIPSSTKTSVIHNQRTLTTMNEFDKDFDDVGTAVLGLTTSALTIGGPAHCPGSMYTYGLVYFDGRMRTNGVVSTATIEIPIITGSGANGASVGDQLYVHWTITGSPPSWAKYYAVVRKRNNTISSIFQAPAVALFYKREDDTIVAGELLESGKVYYGSKTVPSISSFSGNIYWKVPTNLPVSLDNKYRVRLVPNIGQTKTEPIIQVIGDKIITGNFGVTDWSPATQPFSYPLLQFERYKESTDEFFYEVGSMYTITSGNHDTVAGTELGDIHIKTFNSFLFEPSEEGTLSYGFVANQAVGYSSAVIVTQSPTSSQIVVETQKTEKLIPDDNSELSDDFKRTFTPLFGTPTTTATVKTAFTLDYNKIASDNSRVWIKVTNKKTNREPNTISISDKYVLNSQINGMSRFSSQYSLPPNRSPIRKLVNLSSNQFLAIHDRSVTSLATYNGDNILATSDGSEFLGDGKSIIGYDRELQGGYGTIYADSVVTHGDRAWFFDPYKGEACRYAANGITPLASIYKMKTFFREKGDQFINTTGRNVIGGYDPVLQMVYFTFVSDIAEENETIAFIDKDKEERWLTFSDWTTESYVKINNRWFSFEDDFMYEHNVGDTYNNFHGEQQESSFTLVLNSDFNHEKILRSISEESNTIWPATEISVRKNVRNQTTHLVASKFTRRDDVYYADILRDENTYGLSAAQGLVRGEPLIGKSYELALNNDSTELAEINFVNYSFQIRAGHKGV